MSFILPWDDKNPYLSGQDVDIDRSIVKAFSIPVQSSNGKLLSQRHTINQDILLIDVQVKVLFCISMTINPECSFSVHVEFRRVSENSRNIRESVHVKPAYIAYDFGGKVIEYKISLCLSDVIYGEMHCYPLFLQINIDMSKLSGTVYGQRLDKKTIRLCSFWRHDDRS